MKYKTIKQLVLSEVEKLNGKFPDKAFLENLVKENFPNSKWKDTHYSWYKSKIKHGKFEEDNSDLNSEIEKSEIVDSKEFSLSLERDLQSYLSSNLDEIEEGLELVDNGIEFKTNAGFIDLLAKDKNGNYVVIELKASKGKDAVIGQILGYIGALTKELGVDNVRGIIVASDFEDRLKYAISAINNLSLIKYTLTFDFSSVD
ncbi:endonuclease NucS [Riemerella anatipestifer]|uniref:endonuclease NucS domain-containing protein n=1 Tax=Riemerella anatipestifer TaxID=34085 RepID=UPI002A88059D|nr:endonuclease NucS [Riemerella anatipestifer]MDY3524573.1 endonuclease NucS [Riemerella anatipestifer]